MSETPVPSQGSSLQLNYLIKGESIVFVVRMKRNYPFSELKKAIQKKRALGVLGGIDPHTLELWKPNDSEPIIETPADTLVERIESLGDLSKFADQLDPAAPLFTIFSNQPSDEHVHVIVRLPDTCMRGKRAASDPAEGVFNRLKRAKIVTTTPSEAGKLAVYERLQQDSSEKVLDDRPEPDANIPPIPLLYAGFGHFLDIMDGRDDVPGLADVDARELQKGVDGLASTMSGYFTEGMRRSLALAYLDDIFSARRGIKIPPLGRTNVQNTATHGAGSIIVEFKNRSTGINLLPQIEIVYRFARLIATKMDDEARRQLYLRWRVPCLGLTIVGYNITFYAVIPIDRRFRLVTLTPTFSCMELASDGRDRKSLYSAFTAASVLQAHILQDAARLLDNPPAAVIPITARHLPAVSKLRKYPPSSDDCFVFEIRCFFPDRQPYRRLYVAEIPGADDRLVLIKFTRQYSIELHEFCANAGHAPPILGFERLPGGWYAVAMEYIESCVPITHASLLPAHRDRWMAELQCLMDGFHEEDLVHGDLRSANIICKEDSVMLIDFDWGGKDGEVFYPMLDLNNDLLEGRPSASLRITKEDDRRVLANTLAKLKDTYFSVGREVRC